MGNCLVIVQLDLAETNRGASREGGYVECPSTAVLLRTV